MVASGPCWLVVVLLLMECCIAAAGREAAVVSVRGPVSVSRGGRVNLSPALAFRQLPLSTECKVTSIVGNGSSCGAVSPNIFNCSYSGDILYQHYGCFADRELATFMVSTVQSTGTVVSATKASIVSIEVLVQAADPLLAALEVDVAQSSGSQQNGAITLTIVFPSAMVGRCYYEVLSGWPNLPLPLGGRVSGAVNQPLPSGYVPKSALTYIPHSDSLHPGMDYVLIKIYLHKMVNNTLQNSFVILPFKTHFNSTILQENDPVVRELNRDFVIIRQAIHTPITESDFDRFNLTLNLPIAAEDPSNLLQPDPLPVIRYSFPVLRIGGAFRSLYSTSTSVSHTVFTSKDLLAGHVSFHPTYLQYSTSTVVYPYNVTNLAGRLIARGEVAVSVMEINANLPNHRKNYPLSVPEGGTAIINRTTLDFYLLEPCEHRAKLQVLKAPAHGQLVFRNGSQIGQEEIPLWVLKNTTLLRYRHAGGEEPGDVVYWKVKCLSSEFRVFMSVLVTPVDDAPPTLAVQSHLQTYQDWAFPLSPSSLQVVDPDSSLRSLQLTASSFRGTLLKPFQNSANLVNCSTLFPLMSRNHLISLIEKVELYEVLSFSLHDLEQQKIWYVPAVGVEVDSIELTVSNTVNGVGPTIAILQIVISPRPPHQSLLISTSGEYPFVIKNQPLPLCAEGHMYLTSYFLYSQAPPRSSENVRYVVTSGPQHGRLCSIVKTRCKSSLKWFTQKDINHHRIVYQPRAAKHLRNDQISFVVTVGGVSNVHSITHIFNWTVLPQHVRVIKKPFWLKPGTNKRISARFFRTFIEVLGTKNVTFVISEPPRYGNIFQSNGTDQILSRPSSFTYLDVLERRSVGYNHTQRRTPPVPVCSDHLNFHAVSPLQSIQGRLPILFSRGESALSVTIHPYTLLGLTQFVFTSRIIEVSSSFCLEFVVFSVETLPKYGHLSLMDHTLNTERALLVGSTFTAKDIQAEALTYRFTSPYPKLGNMSDSFRINATDPASQWPSDRQADIGRFIVVIVPSPQGEHVLQVNFSSGHPVTWLPSMQSYGYAFKPSDIDLLNSTLQPSEVYIQMDGGLTLGNFARGHSPISFFTVDEVQAGQVFYLKNSVILERVYRDTVELGVYAYLPGFSQKAAIHHLVLEWAVVELEQGSMTVLEWQGSLQLTIRYVCVCVYVRMYVFVCVCVHVCRLCACMCVTNTVFCDWHAVYVCKLTPIICWV